jgi:cytochrome c oxidase assembly protein subunit 15
MSHRLGALALTLVLLLLAWQLRRAGLSRLAGLLLLALGVQISLGIGNVVFHLPLVLAVAHNAGGALLLLTLVLINYRLRSAVALASQATVEQAGFAPLPGK